MVPSEAKTDSVIILMSSFTLILTQRKGLKTRHNRSIVRIPGVPSAAGSGENRRDSDRF